MVNIAMDYMDCRATESNSHKPVIVKEQMVKSSVVSKRLGEYRKKAKLNPVYITENGNIDTVLLDYDYFEKMYERLLELEELQEAKILSERVERLEKDPDSYVSWKDVRRTGK